MSLKWLPNALTILRCLLAFAVGWAILELDQYINLLVEITPNLIELLTELENQSLDEQESFMEVISNGWLYSQLIFVLPFALFVVTALTDFIDGWLARKLDAVSIFGAWLDPLADKLLVAISLLGICYLLDWYWLLLLPSVLIIGRDIVITVMRNSANSDALLVSRTAKWKTAVEMVGIGAYFFAIALPALSMLATMSDDGDETAYIVYPASELTLLASITLLYIAAALSLYTGWQYMRAARGQNSKSGSS